MTINIKEGHLGVQTKKTDNGKYTLIIQEHESYHAPGSSVKTEEWNDVTHTLEFIPASAYQAMLIAGHLLSIATAMSNDICYEYSTGMEIAAKGVQVDE